MNNYNLRKGIDFAHVLSLKRLCFPYNQKNLSKDSRIANQG